MNALYSPHHPLFFFLFGVLFVFALIVLFLGIAGAALREIGLSPIAGALVIGASLAGSYINIPIAKVPTTHHEIEDEYIRIFGILYRIPRMPVADGSTIIAINVGGALIPSLVSIYVMYRYISILPEAILGIVIVAIVTHIVARPTRGLGIVTPAFVPPITAALMAFLIPSGAPYVIAYVSGVLGTLIGADLTNLRVIPKLGARIASIGGAGTFDGVFLSGIIAVLLA